LKVRNGSFHSSVTTRSVVAIALAWVLAFGSGIVPAPASAIVTTDGGVTPSAESTLTAFETGAVAGRPLAWQAAVETTGSKAAAERALEETVAPAPKKKAKKLTVKQTVAKVGRQRGLSKAGVAALLWICKKESNFRPKARSKSGTYHGLFQLSKGIVKGKPWQDPTWNTKRAIKYMKGRYGSVVKAKAFWMAHHWY